jgi:hydrogenase expression/formation protein HypD
MKYIDEFRDRHLVEKTASDIKKTLSGREYRFMEVCGTHTMSIFRFGLRDMLPKAIELLSGPGCPVCVTPSEYIDKAIAVSRIKNVIVTTFGDMIRVPGSHSTLELEKAKGRDIRTVYSTLDALSIARKNPDKEVVFLGIGFETTVPTVARSILMAKSEGFRNYSVLSAHKTMPQALRALASGEINVDGFILPGHVCAITGAEPFGFLASKFGKRCVISGFEPSDIMQSILMLVRQKNAKVEIQYSRITSKSGNPIARRAIESVFENAPSIWRGIGSIHDSGLAIRKKFSQFDAEKKFGIKINRAKEPVGCRCGDVLKGLCIPTECRFFGKRCVPDHPVGACMVSMEGACAAYYKYRGK